MILTEAIRAHRRAGWPRSRLDAFIERKTADIIRFARDQSPYYGRLYKDLPIGASHSSLPSVRKKDLMENFDRVVTDPEVRLEVVKKWGTDPSRIGKLLLDRYIVLHTSGTTGSAGFFLFDAHSWQAIRAVAYARAPKSLPKLKFLLRAFTGGTRIATLCATKGHFALRTIFDSKTPWWEKRLVNRRAIEITDPIPRLVEHLNDFQPHYLSGYSSILAALATEQAEGRLWIRPESIGGGAEPLTAGMRQRIEQAFSSRIYDLYGATEAMAIAVEDRCGFMHLAEDFCVVEPVDAEHRPAPPGEWSDKVFVTNLTNRIMPIIRYELTDSVRLIPEPCECGSPFRRIEIRGRADDTLVLPGRVNSVSIPPIALIALLLEVPGIRQSQIVQESPSDVRANIVPDGSAEWEPLKIELLTRLTAYFRRSGVEGIHVSIEQVQRIERLPGGKIRQIWNRSVSPC